MTILEQPTNGQLSGSPILYYVEETDPGVEKFLCEVYIWRGADTLPASPSFTLTKNPINNGQAVFDISSFVKDFIYNNQVFDYESTQFEPAIGQSCWIYCSMTTMGNTTPTSAPSDKVIAFGGYSEYTEGVNATGNLILNNNNTELDLTTGSRYIMSFTNFTIDDVNEVDVLFDNGGSINAINPIVDRTRSENNLLYFDVSPLNYIQGTQYDEYYTVRLLNSARAVIDLIRINVKCEPKYHPFSVAYVNKNGVWDFLSFAKKSMSSFSTETADYMKNVLTLNSGSMSYENDNAQIQRYNTNQKGNITLNTDFLHEGIFISMQQLFMSENCVLYEFGWAVNPISKTERIKQNINKEMVQYTVDFEKAFEIKSTVR